VVSIHRRVQTTRTRKQARALNFADLTKLGERSRLIAVHGNADSCVSAEVIKLEPVESLGIGSAPLIAQSKIQSQFGSSLPVVLHEEGGFLRFVRYGWDQMQRGVMRVSEQRRGERLAPLV